MGLALVVKATVTLAEKHAARFENARLQTAAIAKLAKSVARTKRIWGGAPALQPRDMRP